MQEYTFVVFTNPVEGLEQEFDDWYVHQHLPDVLRVPGFKSGQRFELQSVQAKPGHRPWRFMTVFELETDDLRGTLDALIGRAHTPAMPMSPSISDDRMTFAFKAVTPKLLAKREQE